MISYIVDSKEYDKADLPSCIVQTLKVNDAFKGMFIMSCACKEEAKEGDDLLVTYLDATNCVHAAKVTIVEEKK
jgi:hypothetical protein